MARKPSTNTQLARKENAIQNILAKITNKEPLTPEESQLIAGAYVFYNVNLNKISAQVKKVKDAIKYSMENNNITQLATNDPLIFLELTRPTVSVPDTKLLVEVLSPEQLAEVIKTIDRNALKKYVDPNTYEKIMKKEPASFTKLEIKIRENEKVKSLTSKQYDKITAKKMLMLE